MALTFIDSLYAVMEKSTSEKLEGLGFGEILVKYRYIVIVQRSMVDGGR